MIRLWQDARLRDRRRHYFVMEIMWTLTVLWITGLIYLAIYRNEMPIILAIVALIAFCFMAPDVKTLFYPYRKYVEELERDNEPGDAG